MISLQFPAKLAPLFKPARYKVFYGGRGGAKSWGFARALILRAGMSKLLIVCAREIQKSIKDSVHRLLESQIDALGLRDVHDVQKTTIINRLTGSEFIFVGLKHNIDNVKSLEGADIVWVEEAQAVSHNSLQKLIPTVRKDDSEIWLSLNPELEDDAAYQLFVVDPPEDASVVKIGWQDNPWFPKVLERERQALKSKDPDAYLHIWEGACKQTLEGAIFGAELRLAQQEGRIGKFPPVNGHRVHTFWDLGYADNTSIWFLQSIEGQFRVIDFYQNHLKKPKHYTDILKARRYTDAEGVIRPYRYDRHCLPHDANNNYLPAEFTTEQIVRQEMAGHQVMRLPRLGIATGLDAVRTIFDRLVFDEERCADGLMALRRYCFDIDETTGRWSTTPLKDGNDHAADALRYMAMTLRGPVKDVGEIDIGPRGLAA